MKRKKTMDKFKHRKMKAADDFKDQLEDLWYLLEKKKRLNRKELITKRTFNEQEEKNI